MSTRCPPRTPGRRPTNGRLVVPEGDVHRRARARRRASQSPRRHRWQSYATMDTRERRQRGLGVLRGPGRPPMPTSRRRYVGAVASASARSDRVALTPLPVRLRRSSTASNRPPLRSSIAPAQSAQLRVPPPMGGGPGAVHRPAIAMHRQTVAALCISVPREPVHRSLRPPAPVRRLRFMGPS